MNTNNKNGGADAMAAFEKLVDRYTDDCVSDGAEGLAYPSVAASLSRDNVNAAVAALIERNAELEAERDDATKARDIARSMVRDLFRERDALAAEVKALREWQDKARPLLAAGATWMPTKKCAMGIREIQTLCHEADAMKTTRASAATGDGNG